MPDDVILNVNGTRYHGWKSMTLVRSIDALCGRFDIAAHDRWPGQNLPRGISEGDECVVFLGDDPVITGYVDGISPGYTSDSSFLGVRGRDKTMDLVDCPTTVDTYEVIDMDLAEIAANLCSEFKIELKVDTDVGAPFPKFSIQPGEKAAACLDRAARQRGVICTTDGRGALVLLSRKSFRKADDQLVEGENITRAAGDYNFADRYSMYRVFGQMPSFNDGIDEPLSDILGIARDANVMRYRPLFLSAEAWTSPESATIRAKNECARRAGKSKRVNVQVVGWRQSSGALWEPGITIHITSPSLYLPNTEMVISSVRYSISDSDGQVTELELTRPDAYLENGEGEVEAEPDV